MPSTRLRGRRGRTLRGFPARSSPGPPTCRDEALEPRQVLLVHGHRRVDEAGQHGVRRLLQEPRDGLLDEAPMELVPVERRAVEERGPLLLAIEKPLLVKAVQRR